MCKEGMPWQLSGNATIHIRYTRHRGTCTSMANSFNCVIMRRHSMGPNSYHDERDVEAADDALIALGIL